MYISARGICISVREIYISAREMNFSAGVNAFLLGRETLFQLRVSCFVVEYLLRHSALWLFGCLHGKRCDTVILIAKLLFFGAVKLIKKSNYGSSLFKSKYRKAISGKST